MPNNKLTGYKDSHGVEYKLNDIVYNPYFEDYWLVQEYETQEEKDENECDYYLALYGDKNYYSVSLDTPDGFVVICSQGDEYYEKYTSSFKVIVKRLTEEEGE